MKAAQRQYSLSSLLYAIQYADSAYPAGRYTLSYGLEAQVQAEDIQAGEQLEKHLLSHIRMSAAPGDGVATAATGLLVQKVQESQGELSQEGQEIYGAEQCVRDIGTMDQYLSANKVSTEMRTASMRVGKQVLRVHRDSRGDTQSSSITEDDGYPTICFDILEEYRKRVEDKETPGNQAIAMGLIHSLHGLEPEAAVAVELMGLAIGWASAALRLRLCDHIESQRIIDQCLPEIEFLAQDCVHTAQTILAHAPPSWEYMGRSAPMLDLYSSWHEQAPARLFLN